MAMTDRASFVYNGHTYHFKSSHPDDKMHVQFHKRGVFYELEFLEDIRKLDLSGVYVDIGANIGNHSVYFAQECKCDWIISVEMVPETFEVLSENIFANVPEKNISLYNDAVVDKPRKVSHVPVLSCCVGGTRVKEDPNGEIDGLTLDQILENVNNIAVIKMDIEEYEYQALLGATETLKKKPKLITTEYLQDGEFRKIHRLMVDAGYRMLRQHGSCPANVMWVPK